MNPLSHQIWKHVLADILMQLKYLPLALVAGILIGCFITVFTQKKQKLLLYTLFNVYLVMLAIITLFKREPGSSTNISLTLFETLGSPQANAYVIENVLLFIPFGILIPRIWKCTKRLSVCTFVGFCLSLGIEITQLLTGRGQFQIDDLLMNAIGAGIGAVIGLIRFRRRNYSKRRA